MYSTVADVREALTPGGVSSDASTAAVLDDDQITDAIIEADSTVDVYLRGRYLVPMVEVAQGEPPVPSMVALAPVRWWSRNIGAWLATLTYRRGKDIGTDDPIRLRYNQTMLMLLKVSNGELDLPFPATEVGSGVGDAIVINLYTGRLFGLEDFNLGYASHVHHPDMWNS